MDIDREAEFYRSGGSGSTQRGADINGEAGYEQSGGAVSLNSYGSIVVIGADYKATMVIAAAKSGSMLGTVSLGFRGERILMEKQDMNNLVGQCL